MKGGFQNGFGDEVLMRLAEVAGMKGLCSLVKQFISTRELKVS